MDEPTTSTTATAALALDDVAGYLLARSLIEPSAIVDGGLTVIDCSRRNRVFLATATTGRCWALKLGRSGTAGAVAREAAVLRRLGGADGDGLARHVPAVAAFDDGVLVMQTERGARDLVAHHAGGRCSQALARDAGRALGRLHALPAATLADLPGGASGAWGLGIHRLDLATMNTMSGAALELVRRIQADDACCGALDALAAASGGKRPGHGDVRWDNVLAVPAARAGRYDRVVLVDWELAGLGDPCLDAGAFLGEYLRAWVRSVPIVDRRDPGRLLARARLPLARARPAMRAFLEGYGRAPGSPELDVVRVTSFAAVRLLEAALEAAARQSAPPPALLVELRLAMNVLLRPRDAARRLLGLGA